MGFERFGRLLAIRFVLILLCLSALGYSLLTAGLHAASILLAVVAALLVTEVFRFVSRTNQELTRFLDAVRYADFAQRFQFEGQGAGFAELGETFTAIIERFREERQDQERELRHLRALLEHVPVPLISLQSDGAVTAWNNAARRLFGSAQVSRIEDLAVFGAEFRDALRDIAPGERRLTRFVSEGVESQLALGAGEIIIAGSGEKLLSLQNIQSELDRTQLRAWQDLVRVLTHEIMNSITPVASLAQTAVDLVEDVQGQLGDRTELVDEMGDVRSAVDTVARRSEGLMQFVTQYRQLTHLPEPNRSRFALAGLFEDVARIGGNEPQATAVKWRMAVVPPELELHADRQMLEQVLINLVQNAVQATAGEASPLIELRASLNSRGRVLIQVADNGPGIAAELAEKIFIPFYTTRTEGSGVGLALARQVMIAHGGSIRLTEGPQPGACFTLVF